MAGDDFQAKKQVIDLVDAMGFDPVDAGSIAESWRQQQGMPAYGTNLSAEGVKEALAKADHGRLVEMRKKNEAVMKSSFGKGAAPDEVVNAVRELHEREDQRKAS